jgi:hypothetical protein
MASIKLAAVRVESPPPPFELLPLPPPRGSPSRSRVPSPPAKQNDQIYYLAVFNIINSTMNILYHTTHDAFFSDGHVHRARNSAYVYLPINASESLF